MSYTRVIPRDLFNEGNLFNCIGRLWIETERLQPAVTMEHDYDAFDVVQDESDGSISVRNLTVYVNGEQIFVSRPLNSRQPWPLRFEYNGDTHRVFNDEGALSAEFTALIMGMSL